MEDTTSDKSSVSKNKFSEIFSDKFPVFLSFTFALGIVALLASIIIFIWTIKYESFEDVIKQAEIKNSILYIASIILIIFISIVATKEVKVILKRYKKDHEKHGALILSVIIGLGMIVLLFKQPYLDMLFPKDQANKWLKPLMFGVGGGCGWVVWYLKQLKEYGELFYVILLTVISGLCWYARLTAPEEVQVYAFAFVLISCLHLAKQKWKRKISNQALDQTPKGSEV